MDPVIPEAALTWLDAIPGVTRIMVEPFQPSPQRLPKGTLQVDRREGALVLRVKAWAEGGFFPLRVTHGRGLTLTLVGRLHARFYPKIAFRARPGRGLAAHAPSARDEDFALALKAHGFTWTDPPDTPRPLPADPVIHTPRERTPVKMSRPTAASYTFVNSQQAAKRLGVSDATISNMIKDGRIKDVQRLGTNTRAQYIIPVTSLEGLTVSAPAQRRGTKGGTAKATSTTLMTAMLAEMGNLRQALDAFRTTAQQA